MIKPLKHPNSDIDFIASPAFFLGPFDVYDREDSLGHGLNSYDPNDSEQLLRLFDVYCFSAWEKNGWTVAHKIALAEALAMSLRNPSYNFSAVLNHGSGCFSLPSSWHIRNPRQFFFCAYSALEAHWGADLRSAGFMPPAVESMQHGT